MPSRFKYEAKSIFLTYSQCPLDPNDVLEELKQRTGSDATNQLKKACIGREQHQDGNFHLHICAWYTHRLRFTDSKYMDIEGYHPNVSGDRIKSDKKALAYVSKECPRDQLVQHNMDIEEESSARECHRKILGKRLTTEKLIDIVDGGEYQLMFDYQNLERNIESYKRDKERSTLLPKPDVLYTNQILERPLIDEDGDPIHMDLSEPKQRHQWIYSDQPNRGKTTFLETMADKYRAAYYSTEEKYQTFPKDTDFVLLDAYRADNCIKWGNLERMCDGSFMYPTKGGCAVRLKKPTVIICSNKPPTEVYKNENIHSFLEARFKIYQLK